MVFHLMQRRSVGLAFILGVGVSSLTLTAADLIPLSQAKLAPNTQISLPQQNGGMMSLKDYQGQIVLVDFWASWCGPCKESFPWMNSLQQRYGNQSFRVVAINLDQEPQQAREFLQKIPAQFDVLFDTNAQLPEAFEVIGMPTSFLLDKNGYIRAQHVGFHRNRIADYEATIQQLLTE